MEESKNSSFCIRPFNSAKITSEGYMEVCCMIEPSRSEFKGKKQYNIKDMDMETWWKSDYVKYLRDSFLKDQRPKECIKCWKKEASGVSSHRTRSNIEHRAIFKNKYEKNLQTINKHNLAFPEDIEMCITNLCNLKCQMCSGQYSSKLLVENNALGYENLRQKDYDLDKSHHTKIQEMLKHDISHLNLIGGEPLFNKDVIDLLEELVKRNKAKQIKLQITTNGTQCSERILNILKNFDDIRLMISVEGVQRYNEYMRFPSEWKRVSSNISQYAELQNTYIYINTVVQNLNVLYINKLVEYAHANNFYIKLEPIVNPDYLNMLNLPRHILEQALANLNSIGEEKLTHVENLHGIIDIIQARVDNYEIDKDKWQKFVTMIKSRDNYRKVHIENYMPELAKEIYK